MKKIMPLLLAFLFVGISQLSAAELSSEPKDVFAGTNITVKYKQDKRYISGEPLKLFIYTFGQNSSTPLAVEAMLNYDNFTNKYLALFTLPSDVIFAFFKVSSGTMDDSNKGEYWEIYVLGKDGKPQKGACLAAALSRMGNLPGSGNRNVNYSEALSLMNKELTLYPDNIQALIGLTSLEFDLRKIEAKEFNNRIETIINKKFDKNDECNIRAVSRALKAINDGKIADQLEKDFAMKHPQSDLAQEIYLSDLSRAETLKDFTAGVEEYLSLFPNSPNRERVVMAMVSGYLQKSMVDEAEQFLDSLDSPPPSAYIQLAMALTSKDNKLNLKSDNLISKALVLCGKAIDAAKSDNTKYNPQYFTETEWMRKRIADYASAMEAYGNMITSMGSDTIAYEYFKKAIDTLDKDATVGLYEDIIVCAVKLDKNSIAYDLATSAIVNSESSEKIDLIHKNLFQTLLMSGSYQKLADSLIAESKRLRKEKLIYEKLDMNVTLGKITSIDEGTLDLSQLKGKVIVLDFWSTWCGPCKESVPAFDDIYQNYKDNPNVLSLSVNIWEKSQGSVRIEDIKKYFKDVNYGFPVYIDENNEMPFDFGLTGLPVRIYIDKSGLMQFKEVGFINDETALRDAVDKIELLLSK